MKSAKYSWDYIQKYQFKNELFKYINRTYLHQDPGSTRISFAVAFLHLPFFKRVHVLPVVKKRFWSFYSIFILLLNPESATLTATRQNFIFFFMISCRGTMFSLFCSLCLWYKCFGTTFLLVERIVWIYVFKRISVIIVTIENHALFSRQNEPI